MGAEPLLRFLPSARRAGQWLGLSVLSALPLAALAQSQAAAAAGPGLPLLIGQASGGTAYSVPIQTLQIGRAHV